MPNEKLQTAVEQLNQYFNVSTKQDLVIELLKPTQPAVGSSITVPNDTDLGKIASLLVSVADGGLDSRGIIKEIDDFIKKNAAVGKLIDEKLMIFSKPDAAFVKDIGKVIGHDLAAEKSLSLFMMKSVQLLPAGRDSNATTLFMNTIPTLEFSRAVPFLDIDIQLARPVKEPGTDRLQMMSLARFLEGSIDIKGTADVNLLLAKGIPSGQGDDEMLRSSAGMELFTSPQTLVNPDPTFNANRSTPVIDPFRPFMSIEKLTVDLTPHVGFFAYRSGELELTLHDRSRLAEIADFIQPDLYSGTELLIEWGWSHPGDNVFGTLLNAMRAREKFRVVNASFVMQTAGEVKIKLKIATKGAADLMTVNIGDGENVIGAGKLIRDLQQKIAAIRNQFKPQQSKKGFAEIRGTQNLLSSAEDLSTALTLTNQQKTQLQNIMKSKDKSVVALKQHLEDLFGKNGIGGVAADFQKSLSRALDNRFNLIWGAKKATRTTDPFLDSADENKWDNNEKNPYVSFGKLMLLLVGVPLANPNSFDDVQLLFYPFNHRAGKVRNKNLAEFEINVNDLRQSLSKLSQARLGNNIPVREFIQFIVNNFIDDMGNPSYGLNNIYTSEIDPKTNTRIRKVNKKLKNDKVVAAEQEAALLEMGIPDGVFKMPLIEVIVETVPNSVQTNEESVASANAQSILRLHFLDKTATRYESMGDLIRQSRVSNVGTLGDRKTTADDGSEHAKLYNIFLAKMKDKNIIEQKEPRKGLAVYELVGSVQQIKDLITDSVPTLTYGSNNSAIKEASFSTMQEPLLTTVNMIRAGKQASVSPEGLSPGNLPLQTLPAVASVTSFGCPLIAFTQQFFVDFQTNTTMDNIYGVNKIRHELSQGKFESKWDLVPLDAYGEYRSVMQTAGAMITEFDEAEKAEKKGAKK